jgi:hypothetical protein
MFIKEMENAELLKKYWFRRFFLFGLGIKKKTLDPRKISKFIKEVTTPYADEINEIEQSDIEKNTKNININNCFGNNTFNYQNDFIKKIETDINLFEKNKISLKDNVESLKNIIVKIENKISNDNNKDNNKDNLNNLSYNKLGKINKSKKNIS